LRLLLDTHALVWALLQPDELGRSARDFLEDPTQEIYFSPISIYETVLKFKLGKWPGVEVLVADCAAECRLEGWIELPINSADANLAGTLPLAHRDPWDRLLAAQAINADAWLLSADMRIDTLGVRRIWA
jgi:PIN domain nuclease of toxin-antitoxin system